jgi:DNA-binding GntR family transcriptional regulator
MTHPRARDIRAAPIPSPQSARIAEEIARAILDRRIGPGAKLSEDEVGEVFGAGRTVTRAALQALAHQGLVELRRNRGAFVARPDPREAREVFEARALLEPRVARLAAGRATPADVALLRAHMAAEHAALAEGDGGLAVYLSGRFHLAIAEISDQKTIAALVATLVARSSLAIALYWKRRDALCETHAHDALVGAIAARDGLLAEELMTSHLVDLLSGLDLGPRPPAQSSLREALLRGPDRDRA